MRVTALGEGKAVLRWAVGSLVTARGTGQRLDCGQGIWLNSQTGSFCEAGALGV